MSAAQGGDRSSAEGATDARAVDLAVIGAGAAGLMAAIWAARTAAGAGRRLGVVALDGAKRLGAKILVAGGGRCNVTHWRVSEADFAGSTRPAIRRVLGRFDVARTVAFFEELGVTLKREDTGKLFPVTDDAHTVLDALLREARRAGVELLHPWRVGSVRRQDEGFRIERERAAIGAPPMPDPAADATGTIHARRVILATGGMALPRTGSDGGGYTVARSMGHSVTERVFPALVPLVLEEQCWVRGLSGLAVPASIEVRSTSGKRLAAFTGSTLCTHFGLSGPAPLDISRYFLDARRDDPGATMRINWTPGLDVERLDALLASRRGVSPGRLLGEPPCGLPERLAKALCAAAGVDASSTTEHLTRERRRALAAIVTEMALPVTGDRGFTHAEATAGGVPLAELDLGTMGSRVCPGLFVCGEVCDVDGRIGGFNFQWAWASGHVAGVAAGA